MTDQERDLLLWLSHEDFSQYGECRGKSLDSLIAAGLVEIVPNSGRKNPFIAKGDGLDFQAVRLTDKGLQAAAEARSQR